MAWHCDVEEIQALLDGELDDAQRQECEAHLTKCESCAGLMDRLAAIRDTLAAVGAASPPPHLRELILEAVAEAEPVPELSCERAIEIASSYLDGELLGQERQVLEAHLFVCPSCYRAFKRMEAAVDILRVEALASAPPGLYRRLVASVERESQRRRTPVLGISGPLPPWRTAIGLAAGLAAAAAIVAAVVLPRGEGPQPMEARAHIVGERSVTLDLAPSATEEESGGLEHRIALAEKVAPTAAAPREVETRPARSSTPPARPTPIVAPPTMALRAVAAVTDREERGEDRQPAEAPAESPLVARAETSANVKVVRVVEDVAGAMAAVAEPATTAPGSPGPIEEPVVAELPEPIALAPGTPPAHETSAETTPTTRGAAPPSKLTPLRKGWDSLYTSAGYDGEKLANLRAKGNEDLNSRHRGRSQVGWPIR